MISLGSDHGGYELKETIKRYLEEKKIEYRDMGCYSKDAVDYPVVAAEVAKSVQKKEVNCGILICRSGIGMSISANKVDGIRAAVCRSVEDARISKMHNDTNIISLGADGTESKVAIEIIEKWLSTEFEGMRHVRRIELINEIERQNKEN